MTTLRWGSATDTGRLRDHNEDALLVGENLFVVADGVGGHAAGEVAAQITVDTLRDNSDATREGIVEAVRIANRAILERADADPETRGMGTTMSAVAIVNDADSGEEMVLVANVGDSRVYRIHRGELEQLSDDHSLVGEWVREGRLSSEEARNHPNRNIVTRVLGSDDDIEVDSWLITPEVGDRYLVCSDGLSDEVDDPTIARTLLTMKDPDEAARRLVELANAAGGRDNITVIVVDVVDDGDRAASASAALRKDPPRTTSQATVERQPTPKDLPHTGVVSAVPGTGPGTAPKQRRITWRAVVFVTAVVAVLVGAVVFVGWFARNTYYVGADGDDVVIYRGRPGGVLWIQPTEAEDTGLTLEDIQPSRREEVEAGHEASSLASARRYVDNITTTTTATTSTTTTSTTTSTTSTTTPTAPATTATSAP